MTPFLFVYLLIVLAYLTATGLSLHGALRRGRGLRRLAVRVAFAGFVLHTLLLAHFFVAETVIDWSMGVYFKLLSWCVLAASFVLWRTQRWDFLALTVSPIALLLFATSLTGAQGPGATVQMPKTLQGLFFALHIGTLFASLGLLAVACVAGAIFLHQERRIKTKARPASLLEDLPGLATMDRINQWTVTAGFPLYTLGMLTGFLFARLAWGRMVSWDPKEIVSLVTWLLFAWLFHGRLFQDWRGRKPATVAIWIFALAAASFVGVNFFLPTHHSMVDRP